MRVVICEDEALIAEAYQAQLEAAGHEVVGVAARPDECLDLCAHLLHDRLAPDVVLVDLQLADGLRGEPLVDALVAMGIPSLIVSGEPRALRADTKARGVLRKSPRFRDVLRALPLVAWSLDVDALQVGGWDAGASRAPAEARYRNPDNVEQTWSGWGRRPAWVNEAVANGRALAEFAV